MAQTSRVRGTGFKPTSVTVQQLLKRRQVSLSLGILNRCRRSKEIQRCFPQSEDFELEDDEDWDHFSVSGASVDVVEYEEGVWGLTRVLAILLSIVRLRIL